MHKKGHIPYPRGGRHFGDGGMNHTELSTSQSLNHQLLDINDGYNAKYNNAHLCVPKDKRKVLLQRLGIKKSRSDLSASNGNSVGDHNGQHSHHNRKDSNESSHWTGKVGGDDTLSHGQGMSILDNLLLNERKRLDNRSEDSSISSANQLNNESYNKNTDSKSTHVESSAHPDLSRIQRFDSGYGVSTLINSQSNEQPEIWVPPDSWGYEPQDPSIAKTIQVTGAPAKDEDHDEECPVVDEQKLYVTKKNHCIRVFRQNGTFVTLQLPLNTRVDELMQKLASKFFMNDVSKMVLIMKRHKLQRVLQFHERPLQIQKMLLEQMGYTAEDCLEDVGRDDNTYLVRFIFSTKPMPLKSESWVQTDNQHIDLQARNLPVIPIFLYKSAACIISLDLSKNMSLEIPVDFIQMCINLKQLGLANNDYVSVPPSIHHATQLEFLNISENRLSDLQHARLEELHHLKTLRAFNNRLETLPSSFKSFKHLTMLLIDNNNFATFPTVICDIVSLTYIDISFNQIAAFPDDIGNLTNLNQLFAVGNKLEGGLPPRFSNLMNLKVLDLRHNMISYLDVVCELPKLEYLFVDNNAMETLHCLPKNLLHLKMTENNLALFHIHPAELQHTANIPQPLAPEPDGILLTDLNLANCKLTALPDQLFSSLPYLESLVLDGNALYSLPSSIGVLQKLVQLSARDNNLDSLPMEISKLSELRSLDVQKNELKELPKEIWLCGSLQTLNCSSNMLESFPEPCHIPGMAMHLPFASQVNTAATAADDVLLGQRANSVGSSAPSESGFHMDRSEYKIEHQDSFVSVASTKLQSPPHFNPPSFFASPQNHPPPLSLSLRALYLADNRLSNEIWSLLTLFLELRTLNLSFNDLSEIPAELLRQEHLRALYLSGNHLTSLPADDIVKLTYLRVLAINGNKLQTIPAEIGKLRRLSVLDVSNNLLKYNISNWPYDWNWNWNLGLKYLNLSGNKRLEIKQTQPDPNFPRDKSLSDFSSLTALRMLGLMDITILGVSIPEELPGKRVRTSPSEVNGMSYGIADWLGPNDFLPVWDLVLPRMDNNDQECLLGLFDGLKSSRSSCKVTKYLNDHLVNMFTKERKGSRDHATLVGVLRRTFLNLEKRLGAHFSQEKDCGASAIVCFLSDGRLYLANAGDAMAVMSRNGGQAHVLTNKHDPLHPDEISRIRASGGFVTNKGLLNDELKVSRGFGYFDMVPILNADPFVYTTELNENDEFLIMASGELWKYMSYQTAVDIVRTDKNKDMMAAAQKLRDFALSYGADKSLMVMALSVGDLFDKRGRRQKRLRANSRGASGSDSINVNIDESYLRVSKNKRRDRDDAQSESALNHLDREVPPPVNQVALVFTDIKSSTLLWESHPESMRLSIKIHDMIMRQALRTVGGYEVKTEGDAFMACFQTVTAALLWCFTVQLQLLEADWPAEILETEECREIEANGDLVYRGLSVRMGIHWGIPVFERNPVTNRMDYFGPVVNKASRICSAADGGQICVSADVLSAMRDIPGGWSDGHETADESHSSSSQQNTTDSALNELKQLGFCVMELGARHLKGLETPETLSLVYPKQLEKRMEFVIPPSPGQTPATGSLATSPRIDPNLSQLPSRVPSPIEGSEDRPTYKIPESANMSPIPSKAPFAPIVLEHRSIDLIESDAHIVDPTFVCALNNLALRLERLTAMDAQARTHPKSNVVSTMHTMNSSSFENPSILAMIEQRILQTTSDEELLKLADNFVSRIENAVSALYLKKVGHFANVLGKLGEAIELDLAHVLRALQMYAQVIELTEGHVGCNKYT